VGGGVGTESFRDPKRRHEKIGRAFAPAKEMIMSLQETLASIAKSGLPLQGKLDALKFEFETKLAPKAAVEALHRSTDELISSGAQNRSRKVGDLAPEFTLPDVDGNPVSIGASGAPTATST